MYRLIRDLHLYGGLFLSPFLVVYAVSAVLFNHPGLVPRGEGQEFRRVASVRVPHEEDSLRQARAILAQIGVVGEVNGVTGNRAATESRSTSFGRGSASGFVWTPSARRP